MISCLSAQMVRNARISALDDDNYVEDTGMGDAAYVDGEEDEKGSRFERFLVLVAVIKCSASMIALCCRVSCDPSNQWTW